MARSSFCGPVENHGNAKSIVFQSGTRSETRFEGPEDPPRGGSVARQTTFRRVNHAPSVAGKRITKPKPVSACHLSLRTAKACERAVGLKRSSTSKTMNNSRATVTYWHGLALHRRHVALICSRLSNSAVTMTLMPTQTIIYRKSGHMI